MTRLRTELRARSPTGLVGPACPRACRRWHSAPYTEATNSADSPLPGSGPAFASTRACGCRPGVLFTPPRWLCPVCGGAGATPRTPPSPRVRGVGGPGRVDVPQVDDDVPARLRCGCEVVCYCHLGDAPLSASSSCGLRDGPRSPGRSGMATTSGTLAGPLGPSPARINTSSLTFSTGSYTHGDVCVAASSTPGGSLVWRGVGWRTGAPAAVPGDVADSTPRGRRRSMLGTHARTWIEATRPLTITMLRYVRWMVSGLTRIGATSTSR